MRRRSCRSSYQRADARQQVLGSLAQSDHPAPGNRGSLRIDDEQRDLIRQLAELREETRPEVTVQKHGRGVFGRLRDAFAGQ